MSSEYASAGVRSEGHAKYLLLIFDVFYTPPDMTNVLIKDFDLKNVPLLRFSMAQYKLLAT